MEQLDYPIQGDINWRHTRTVKARGGGWGLWSGGAGGGQRRNSPQTSKECHPTGSIHCWRPIVRTRPDFQNWESVFQRNGSSSWRAWLNKTRTQSPTINRGALSGLFSFMSVFSCVISPSVLPAIVHSWVTLACVLFGQFSSAYPGPTQGLATIVKDAFESPDPSKNAEPSFFFFFLFFSCWLFITWRRQAPVSSVCLPNVEGMLMKIGSSWPLALPDKLSAGMKSLSYGFARVSQWQHCVKWATVQWSLPPRTQLKG